MSLYLALKTLHVFCAAVAIGTNATYVFLLLRARGTEHAAFALRTVAFLDAKVANTAYGLAFVSGAVLVRVGSLPWGAPWIAGSLALFAATTILGFGLYTPVLRRQIAAFEREGPGSDAYRAVARQSQLLGAVLSAMVLAIVVLMVSKPATWR